VRLLGIGAAAGFLGALFGVGGGLVIVPALIMFCAFETRQATATSLTAVLVTAVAGTITYAFHGAVEPGPAAVVGIPAIAGVVIGTALQQRIPVHRLTYAFALLLVLVAVRLFV
jgi:uncharacterized membrane protein YfcA